MTANELRDQLCQSLSADTRSGQAELARGVARDAITELTARDREMAELRERAEHEKIRADGLSEISQMQEVEIAELRERVKPPFVTHKVYDKLRVRAEKAEHDLAEMTSACTIWKQRAEKAETSLKVWQDSYRQRYYELSEANRDKNILQQELDEYAFLFELANKRTSEVTQLWRETTGQHNVSPDLGVLLEWLLGYKEDAEKLADLLELYADMPHTEGCECSACDALTAYREVTTTQEET